MRLFSAVHGLLTRLQRRQVDTAFGTASIYPTIYGGKIIRVLNVDNSYQSATYLGAHDWCDLPFPYLRLFDEAFGASQPPHDLLMLGGGGFAFPKHVLAHRAQARIDVVEIDHAIVQIARQYFFLDRALKEYDPCNTGRLRIIEQDALAYLRACQQQGTLYDAILNDCFASVKAEQALTTVDALRIVNQCLSSSGIYMTNVVCALEGPQAEPLDKLVTTLCTVFAYVGVLPCNRRPPHRADNVIVVAAQRDPHISGCITLYEESR